MVQLFWTMVGWVTVPGFMFAMIGQQWDEPIIPSNTRQDIWVVLGLSLVFLAVYIFAAIHFNSGILAPITGIIGMANFLLIVMSSISLTAGCAAPKNEA